LKELHHAPNINGMILDSGSNFNRLNNISNSSNMGHKSENNIINNGLSSNIVNNLQKNSSTSAITNGLNLLNLEYFRSILV
jgi:hypothetical protein